jgi:plasmid stability protein
MASSLLIRDLGEETKAKLRIRAARMGHSMAQEAREILREAVVFEDHGGPEKMHLVDRIRLCLKRSGGGDIPAVPRELAPEPLVLKR